MGKTTSLLSIFRGHRAPPGAAPGTLLDHPEAEPSVIRVVRYGLGGLDEQRVENVEQIKPLLDAYHVTWINVDGLADLELVRQIGEMFDLHRLALEDVVSISQRPKTEEYENFLFVVTRMPHLEHFDGSDSVEIEQISFFLQKNVLITFQEAVGDCFDPVRERIRKQRGLIRGEGADYLMYALLDAVVDSYFPILEHFGDRVEDLNERILLEAVPDEIREMHEIRGELLKLRRAIWPQRDVFTALLREQKRFVGETAAIYLRDCYDHAIQLLDLVETYREIASTSMELYMTSVNNRMNEIMKVLTIISTIFIPMSFVTGLYGMNFNTEASPLNMPELHWYFGYPFALTLMACIAGALVVYFWRKGWLTDHRGR